jgi:hypothetical protein
MKVKQIIFFIFSLSACADINTMKEKLSDKYAFQDTAFQDTTKFNIPRAVKLLHDTSNNLTKVVFKNGIEFDLLKNNPFNELNFKKFAEKYNGNVVYDVKGMKLKEIFPSILFHNFNYDEFNGLDSLSKPNALTSSCFISFSEDTTIVCAVYELDAYKHTYLVGTNTQIWIFNNDGSINKKIFIYDANILNQGITNDSKFIFITYGWDGESVNIIKYGFRIYEISSGKIIVDKKINNNGNNFGAYSIDNLIVLGYTTYSLNNEKHHLEIYNLYNNNVYKKDYITGFFHIKRDIVKYTTEYPSKGDTLILDYNKDFKVEAINK